MKKTNGKLILYGAGGIILLLLMLVINPFGYNDLGYREVVETPTGQNHDSENWRTECVFTRIPQSKIP